VRGRIVDDLGEIAFAVGGASTSKKTKVDVLGASFRTRPGAWRIQRPMAD
jgi:hypothetical protein